MNAYILGTQRSGTTLLSSIIGSHPSVYSPHPAHLYSRISMYINWCEKNQIDLIVNDMKDHCINLLKHNSIKYKYNAEEVLKNLNVKSSNAIDFLQCFLKEYAKNINEEVLLIKEVNLYKYARQILNTDENSRFIYIHRDPREVVASFSKLRIGYSDYRLTAAKWKKEQKCISKLMKVIPAQNFVEISYEKLLKNSGEEVAKVLDILELKYHKKQESYYMDTDVVEKSKISENWRNINKSPNKNIKEKNLELMTEKQLLDIERICNVEMSNLGYEKKNLVINNSKECSKNYIRELINKDIKNLMDKKYLKNLDDPHINQQIYFAKMFRKKNLIDLKLRDPATMFPLRWYCENIVLHNTLY